MFSKFATLILVAFLISVVSSFPHREALDCTGKSDGVYPDPDDNRGYYVCFDHRATVHLDCDIGHHFDDSFKTCVRDTPQEGETPEEDEKLMEIGNAETNEAEVKNMKEEISKFFDEHNLDLPGGQDPQVVNRNTTRNVYNIQFTENVFPRSVLIIGKMNREQKNK